MIASYYRRSACSVEPNRWITAIKLPENKYGKNCTTPNGMPEL
jgi:hypothetical protein